MRVWVSASALLIVVALVATFAVGSIIIVVQAVADLHTLIRNADQGLYGDTLYVCDPLDLSPCF
jgi:hypothetical protein